jgi:hypothetical protein
MPHFTLFLNDDGSIRQILRDNEPYGEGVQLEPAHSIVSTYFRIASDNITAMERTENRQARRFYGLQAFLTSLTGVEAFTNVIFTLLAEEHGIGELSSRAARRDSLLPRLTDCIQLAFQAPLQGQHALLERIRELYQLRNQIVHPRWNPVALTIPGETPLQINGLAENFQATFENPLFCREAFLWCLLLVVRVALAAGNEVVDGFCFLWTGQRGVTEAAVMSDLGLPSE